MKTAKSKVGLSKPMKIAHEIEQDIKSGRIVKGDQLGSEYDLVRRFSVSRNTVRKGLEYLASKGLITTKTGIGSFVIYDDTLINNALGWTLALNNSADKIETKIIRIKRGKCSTTNHFLQTKSNDFLCIDRVRIIQNSNLGISLERSRSPWRKEYLSVLKNGLVNDSLGETFASIGLIIDNGEEWADVLPKLSKTDAKIMSRSSQEPMFRLRRLTRTTSGEAIEFVESILDPSRFRLHLEF